MGLFQQPVKMEARYAIYYTPPRDSPLGRFGIAWLGWDHYRGRPVAPLETRALTGAQHAEVTASPRRYGFHATLKAPFRLAAGRDESELCGALADFAGERAPVTIPGLFLARLGGFVALVPSRMPPGLADLADACVAVFDPFRSALDPADIARRRAAGLTPRQHALLYAWGYPYVLEEWRFHLTLTGTLQDGAGEAVLEELVPRVAVFACQPLRIEAVALFRQPDRETPFTVRRVFPLRGAAG
jgi:putative phosphonate metabolism protein